MTEEGRSAPEAMLDLLLEENARVARAVAAMQERGQQLAQVLGGLSEAGRGSRGDQVETLLGSAAVRAWLVATEDDVRVESTAFVPGRVQSRASLEAAAATDRGLLARGVRLRTIYQTAAASDPATRRHVAVMSMLGEQVRTVPSLPLRLVISDRSTVLLPIDLQDSSAGAVVIRAPGAVAAMVSLFESYWSIGEPFARPVRDSREGLTGVESSVLRALAAGERDEDIAAALAISPREFKIAPIRTDPPRERSIRANRSDLEEDEDGRVGRADGAGAARR